MNTVVLDAEALNALAREDGVAKRCVRALMTLSLIHI